MSSQYPVLHNRPIDQWKVTELKEELRRRKLTLRGLKEDLVKRLHEAILEERESYVQEESVNVLNHDSDHQDIHSEVELPVGTVEVDSATAQVADDIIKNIGEVTRIDNDNKNGTVFNHEFDRQDIRNEEQPPGATVKVHSDTADVADDKVEDIGSDITLVNNDNSTAEDGQETKVHVEEINGIANLGGAGPETVSYAVPTENNPGDSQSMHAEIDSSSQEPMLDERKEGRQPSVEEIAPNLSKPNNQVSEVSHDLGFQVMYESISTDSVSIIDKNELKDNLNADIANLELVKPEIMHSSSSDVAPTGADLQPLDDVLETSRDQGSVEEIDDEKNVIYGDDGKKNDTDLAYPEKLNLDRSSGDESMEEDVLESKQIASNINSEEVENKTEVIKEETPLDSGAGVSSPRKNDVITEEENKPSLPAEKRKIEEQESPRTNEPIKRQRRWNSGTLKVPEQQVSDLSLSGTSTGLSQTTPKRALTRSGSTLSGDGPKERIVPPSQKPATTSLRIDRFLRPFTIKAVQELLSKTGKVSSFWMDNIKTHCYVTFSSEEEAIETRNAVYNLQWPPNGGRLLVAEFVDPEEVKMRVEAPPESPAPISPNPTTPSTSIQQPPVTPSSSRQHGPRQQSHPQTPLALAPPLYDPPLVKQLFPQPPAARRPEPPIVTLDDLFMKTTATPRIYYLPLTEEQVAAKRAARGKNTSN